MKDQPIPQFSGISLSGKTWNTDSLKGKVTLFSFWFIGCMPCMNEINTLNQLNREYKNDKNFIFLSVAPQVREDLKLFNDTSKNNFSDLRKVFHADPIEYEIIPTCIARKERKDPTKFSLMVECANIVENFNVWGYPQIYISDKKGIIRFIHKGFVQDTSKSSQVFKMYKSEIDSLLKN